MASGMDRLERFFYKKRSATSRSSSGASKTSKSSGLADPALFIKAAAGALSSSSLNFPQASFIRPRSGRMLPREDLTSVTSLSARPSTASRSRSLPEAAQGNETRMLAAGDKGQGSDRRNTVVSSYQHVSTAEPVQARPVSSRSPAPCIPPVPRRSSSLLNCRRDTSSSLAPLSNFQLPPVRYSIAMTLSDASGETSPRIFSSESLLDEDVSVAKRNLPPQLNLQLDDLQDLQPLFMQPSTYTPPPSDHDEKDSFRSHRESDGTLYKSTVVIMAPPPPRRLRPSAPILALPAPQHTPAASPAMKATPDSVLAEPQPLAQLISTPVPTAPATPPKNNITKAVTPTTQSAARTSKPLPPSPATRRKARNAKRPASLRNHRKLPADPTSAPASPSSVLKEPNLGEFLSLSDEDIAESEPIILDVGGRSDSCDSVQTTPTKKNSRLSKPLPRTPPPSSAPSSVYSLSPSVSPASMARRRSTLRLDGPPSRPPSYQAPPRPVPSKSTGLLPPAAVHARPQTQAQTQTPTVQTPTVQARMVAAFEVARIASQYHFDLAYIAAIWPKNMVAAADTITTTTVSTLGRSWPPSPPMSPLSLASPASRISRLSTCSSVATCSSSSTARTSGLGSQGSPAPMSPRQSGMEAQFLAAYGLATVKAPYSLSAPTHSRLLNADGWLQFSEPHAKPHDFATGFGCAFYRGHAAVANSRLAQQSRRPSMDDCCDADTEDGPGGCATPRPRRAGRRPSYVSAAHNRGIVFVAYRRQDAAAASEPVDLNALHRDVEALVDKILDFHMQQQRQSQLEMLRAMPDMAADILARPLRASVRV